MSKAITRKIPCRALCAVAVIATSWLQLNAQTVDVSARVELAQQTAHGAHGSSENVVVWLTPLQNQANPPAPKAQDYTLAQKDKMFHPHLLVVPVGSSVDFPNLDPFFHNVFSLFNGKRFDLGLYEGHTHRTVHFDREGVSYIFCNIHPNMGAVIVSLSTPYYAISSADGGLIMRDVPVGRYRMNVWAENVSVDRLADLGRIVDVSPQSSKLGMLHLESSGNVMNYHQNKFGESYNPAIKQPY